jgi:CheY-like chemotaxis protein
MKSFLLVDDDIVFNFLNEKILEQTGIAKDIRSAANGEEALALIETSYNAGTMLPDVILLDLNMPVMDGFGFLAAFNQRYFTSRDSVKIIVVSSSQDKHDIQRARALGARAYLSKPLTYSGLLEALA